MKNNQPIVIIYKRNGTLYKSVFPRMGKNALEIAIVGRGIGRSEIVRVENRP